MKLLFCKNCQDIVRLFDETRVCKCGKTSGAYINELDAWYSGDYAIPIGFQNSSLGTALRNQPEEGLGFNFTAFVIPKECPTFKLRQPGK